ncbi:MAG: carboxypeptidase-like regulatory domain-containing protein [Paramuribaculum sp.]|nr:carboxypeptidase-like regulatory domain-containing protein [Paramuribaculum sp.]
MLLRLLMIVCVALPAVSAEGRIVLVADSSTCEPLSGASVFTRSGAFAGMTGKKGRLPYIPAADFPITVRYMGFRERTVGAEMPDTIFLVENPSELAEVVVSSKAQKALHILAYVREYSTLSTYTDTVFMFREKTVDYMIPTERKSRFRGWRNPRILYSKSYYRFTNAQGRDSVSDACAHHFSWADWIEILPETALPQIIALNENASDTVFGRYSPTETWTRIGDKIRLDLDILADHESRKWVPNLSAFFSNGLDYERFKLQVNYANFVGNSVGPLDMSGYSFNIESNGRGREMFMFNRSDQPIYVTTYGEVYIVDKEFITIGEAKKWDKREIGGEEIGIIEAREAPPLQAAVVELIGRVNEVDHDKIRLAMKPDQRLVSHRVVRSFGAKVLMRIKDMFGISSILGKRKQKKNWREFRRSRHKGFHIERIESDSIPQ